MQNKKLFVVLEQVLIISIFQYIFCNFFHFKITPSFYLIYLLILSFDGNVEISLFLSLILGLIQDILNNEILGITSIRYLLIVYFSSFFVVKSIRSKCSLIFIFSFLYFVMFSFGEINESFWDGKIILKYSILFSFYNLLIGILIESIIREIRKKWKEKIF
ncbi:MAG: rod shape-determining protein MreD [Candidatus Omnitrophica bacterium]|nr:rod shape-determining protein MreD [Candidatus Omnitrophota bacterium]MCM8802415.1 rod shape-determining protein MreD [Candidatus Omnitrophota bacterium]